MDQITVETLETCKEYLPKLIEGINKAVELLQKGEEQEGMGLLVPIFEGMEWITSAVVRLQGFGIGSSIALNELTDHFGELEQSLGFKDFTTVTDLFQYEIIPVLERWQTELVPVA